MTEPKFVPIDLPELAESGVLMAANKLFFWPLGLALTWQHDEDHDPAHYDLHVRQWEYEDGHRERIELAEDDMVGQERKVAWQAWVDARIEALVPEERDAAVLVKATLAFLWDLSVDLP